MRKILLILFLSFSNLQSHAATVNLGIFGGADSRDEVDDGSIYAFI